MDSIKYEAWGEEFELNIYCDRYAMGGGLAMELVETGEQEPFTGLTVNLKDYPCEENCAFVDVNDFPEAIGLIEKYKLGESTGRIGISGWCAFPEYRFNMDEIEKYRLRPKSVKEKMDKKREKER